MTELLQTETSSPMTVSSRTTTLCPVWKRSPIREPWYRTVPLRRRAAPPRRNAPNRPRSEATPSRTPSSELSPSPTWVVPSTSDLTPRHGRLQRSPTIRRHRLQGHRTSLAQRQRRGLERPHHGEPVLAVRLRATAGADAVQEVLVLDAQRLLHRDERRE